MVCTHHSGQVPTYNLQLYTCIYNSLNAGGAQYMVSHLKQLNVQILQSLDFLHVVGSKNTNQFRWHLSKSKAHLKSWSVTTEIQNKGKHLLFKTEILELTQ